MIKIIDLKFFKIVCNDPLIRHISNPKIDNVWYFNVLGASDLSICKALAPQPNKFVENILVVIEAKTDTVYWAFIGTTIAFQNDE